MGGGRPKRGNHYVEFTRGAIGPKLFIKSGSTQSGPLSQANRGGQFARGA